MRVLPTEIVLPEIYRQPDNQTDFPVKAPIIARFLVANIETAVNFFLAKTFASNFHRFLTTHAYLCPKHVPMLFKSFAYFYLKNRNLYLVTALVHEAYKLAKKLAYQDTFGMSHKHLISAMYCSS